jgi:hypothetical protein
VRSNVRMKDNFLWDATQSKARRAGKYDNNNNEDN